MRCQEHASRSSATAEYSASGRRHHKRERAFGFRTKSPFTSGDGPSRNFVATQCFSNRPFGVKRFQTIRPVVCRYHSRARALIRNRHSTPNSSAIHKLPADYPIFRQADIERFSVCTEPVAFDPNAKRAMSASLSAVWGQALSDYPPLRCRCRSRAPASLRNWALRPFHHGVRGGGGTI